MAGHAPWCAVVDCDQSGCYSDPIDTPVGAIWAQDSPGGPLVVADPVRMTPATARALRDALTRVLSEIGPEGA